jgi:polynucleotide 5'-hydroxyl-kinase GRC3/NOL9
MIIGGVDTGKTSFGTFLVNSAVKMNLKTGIIDADLGQSDVGPPSTIGFNIVSEPINDLFEVDVKDAIFVGSTSPSGVLDEVTFGINYIKDKLVADGVDFIVINTDGWIREKAAEYKTKLVKSIAPSAIVGMQAENELDEILDDLVNSKVLVIKSPKLIHPRNRETRKQLRELSYRKYMKGAKIQSLSFKWVKVRNSILGSGSPLHHNLLNILCNMLGVRIVYSEESVNDVLVVLKKSEKIPEKRIKKAEQYCGKAIKVLWEGDEKGLLVGLLDDQNHFLGIGILDQVDYKRKILKIYTPVKMKISSLIFGHVKLNRNFQEIGLSTIYSKNL